MLQKKEIANEVPIDVNDIKLSVSQFIALKDSDVNKDYQFGGRIGEGGYGFVYSATHRKTHARRAIKAMNLANLRKQNPSADKKFLEEVEILKTLSHPNILKLYEVYHDDTMMHIVTELAIGGELFSYIERMESNISEKTAAHYMK